MNSADQRLLSGADIRALADELDLRPTKTLGQNYVIDPNTIRRIVAAAELDPQDHVLEVGPGLGSLTIGLVDEVATVTAIEIDPTPARALPGIIARYRPDDTDRVRIIEADALKFTRADYPEELVDPTALVANLPYNVAVPVLLNVLAEFDSIDRGLIMVQQEVADRLCAAPGSKIYGVPSVKLAWYAEATPAGSIGTHVFWPAPRITSGLVRFHKRTPPDTTATRDEVFAVIDAAFAQRRKTLRAALGTWAGSPAQAEQALRAAGIDPSARGETLGIEEYARLAAHRPPAAHGDRS